MIIISQATTRVRAKNTGYCFPSIATTTPIRTVFAKITAANGNAGTVYLAFAATNPQGFNATSERNTLIPLTHGQSITYIAQRRGARAIHDWAFGTGRTYVLGNASGQRMILTYYRYA